MIYFNNFDNAFDGLRLRNDSSFAALCGVSFRINTQPCDVRCALKSAESFQTRHSVSSKRYREDVLALLSLLFCSTLSFLPTVCLFGQVGYLILSLAQSCLGEIILGAIATSASKRS